MTSPEQPESDCPVERLARMTREGPDSPLPEDLCHHLENCQACRARLEESVAPSIDWKLVREALKEPPYSPGESKQGDPLGFSLLRLLTPSDDPSIVGRIGTFEITQVIGSGGMGMVLKARDPALDRFVAVKILAPHLAASATARKRFAREAKAAAAVIHDNVIGIYQVSEHHELPYLVMPYLPDPSLQQRLDSEGKLDVETALSIALQVAKGLEAAHSQGLIHRDVKPANVLLVQATGRAIITDFGLARAADDASLTNSGVLAGTPHYMSPEQARAESVDARTDLFSLGSLLFAMVSGHPPVNRELGSETIRAIASETMPRLSDAAPKVPFWLDRLVAWLHQSDPSDRPQTAKELAGILEQCLQHLRDPASHPLPNFLTTQEGNSMPTEKDKRLFAVAALGMFVITLLAPVQIAMLAPHVEHLPLVFACISFFLTLCFALLSWTEYISRFVVKAAVSLALVGVLVSGTYLGIRFLSNETWAGKTGQQQIDLQNLRNEIAQLLAQQQEKQSNLSGSGRDADAGGAGSMMMGGEGGAAMGGGMMGGPMGGGGPPGINNPSVPGNAGMAPPPIGSAPILTPTTGGPVPGNRNLPPAVGGTLPPVPMDTGPEVPLVLPPTSGSLPPPAIQPPVTSDRLPGLSRETRPPLTPGTFAPPPALPTAPGTLPPPSGSVPPGSVPPLADKTGSLAPPPANVPPAGSKVEIDLPMAPLPGTRDTLPPPLDRKAPDAKPTDGPLAPPPSLNPPSVPSNPPSENKNEERNPNKSQGKGPSAFFRVNNQVPYVQVKKMVDLMDSLHISLDVKTSEAPGNVLEILLPDGVTKEEVQKIRKRLEPEVAAFPAMTVHFVQKGKALVDPLKFTPKKPENLEVLEGADADPKDELSSPLFPEKAKPDSDSGKRPEEEPAKGTAKEATPATVDKPEKDKPASPPKEKSDPT